MTDEELQRENELHDVNNVMATPEGRRVMWRLMEISRVFQSCFTGNSRTFYLEGRRDVGLEFYADIMEICPEQMNQAILERKEREELENGITT
jgi:hypothetical protein